MSPAWSQDQLADTTRFDEVRSLVNFYEFLLNSVGSAKSSTRDKEVIVTQSFKKVFVDKDVQIEDDLVQDRKVITNKDVTAYLRDVDFFFQGITFDFEDIQIEMIQKEEGVYYYLVSFENHITGTTLEGETYDNIKKRFVEVNSNEESGDLKIASVYSTKVSRERELQAWWESLSYGWVKVFKSYVPFDSVNQKVLRQIAAIDSLDLSGNDLLLNLEPLAALRALKVVDISQTQITDISPLRYARDLNTLRAEDLAIDDVGSLEYFGQLKKLSLANTQVIDITPIGRLKSIEQLNLSGTRVQDFSPLAQLTTLRKIDLSNTPLIEGRVLVGCKGLEAIDVSNTSINDLSVFGGKVNLVKLNVSQTPITGLVGLSNLPALEVLTINETSVKDLTPLQNLPGLKKVYADYTQVTEEVASAYMTKNPQTLIVTNSDQVMQWWNALSANWKIALKSTLKGQDPGKEEIIKLINRDSLVLAGGGLRSTAPLKKFDRIKYLDVSQNQFGDFSFTSEMSELHTLIGKDLKALSAKGLEKNRQLRRLVLTGSAVQDIEALSQLSQLELVDLDGVFVNTGEVVACLQANPKAVVIYQTDILSNWWDSLSPEWQQAFGVEKTDTYHLHQLIEKTEVSVSGMSVASLEPFNMFINLEEVTLDRVSMSSLDQLYVHTGIRKLTCTNGPLESLKGIAALAQLESLNVSNTAIGGLSDLKGLTSLKELNGSGTSITSLKGVSELHQLELLDVSNTRIWRLGRLSELQNLKKLICNNTRLLQMVVDDFKTSNPECEVVYY
ncbi:hypothetical protein BFP72_11845 [Reichenbachiella sp. 5M10]|nr:hypothetical protein BFP72_11845 [Reichenbachiella sp. 5M10]